MRACKTISTHCRAELRLSTQCRERTGTARLILRVRKVQGGEPERVIYVCKKFCHHRSLDQLIEVSGSPDPATRSQLDVAVAEQPMRTSHSPRYPNIP
jgi:hypothetical protein